MATGIIIACEKNKKMDIEIVKQYSNTYSGGYGYSYSYEGEIYTAKFKKRDSFIQSIEKKYRDGLLQKSGIIIFVGTNTYDTVDIQPYESIGGVHMIQDGYIGGVDKLTDCNRSNSYKFASTILSDIKPEWLENKHFSSMLRNSFGAAKTVFLYPNGDLTFVNKSKGSKFGDMWTSSMFTTKHISSQQRERNLPSVTSFMVSCKKCRSRVSNENAMQLSFFDAGVKKQFFICPKCFHKYANGIHPKKVGFNNVKL